MSRACRFSDFEAFLRNHSEASPSRQSDHAGTLAQEGILAQLKAKMAGFESEEFGSAL